MTYKQLKEWIDEEFKNWPREQKYTYYVGLKGWKEIENDETHPFHSILKRQKEEYLKKQAENGKKERGTNRNKKI